MEVTRQKRLRNWPQNSLKPSKITRQVSAFLVKTGSKDKQDKIAKKIENELEKINQIRYLMPLFIE